MNNFTKWIISLLGILFVAVTFSSTANASETHDGIPAPIQGKYWSATVSRGTNATKTHMYFYATKDGFVIKNTVNGTLRCKWMLSSHVYGTYLLNGADDDDLSTAVWIFITPNKNWSKIKIGYTKTDDNSEPKHQPYYYQRYTATRVSKVTAIVH
ncbi:hypothetical protein ABC628_10910 [Lentilactobacillus otakiensis]|uniref:hypothetical protein n=1 Tax=Lentilactobacillus otakiensis TaxID=481720 RepID=UPI00058656D8|nr:hypothetical protein [Lentilactobacillus otakiensis]MBZ3777421.1 hypothetical protein [Lentilactobacillus otakiensis]MDV3517715.1 hypothetical protein [Lentilactobacillus otakiensis]